MYGTLGNKAEPNQAKANEKNLQQPEIGKEYAQDGQQQQQQQQQQARHRRQIFSHCHIQTKATGGICDNWQDRGAQTTPTMDYGARRRLVTASLLCLAFMICEIVGGILSNSLAIATDAAHLLTDFASFMISLFALWLSTRPASRRMSFGWYRAEVIGALVSVLMIWLVTGLLVYLAIERLRMGQFEIDSKVMVVTALAGLLVNLFMAMALNVHGHGHSHGSGGGGGHSHSHGQAHANHSHRVHVNEPSHCAGGQKQATDALVAAATKQQQQTTTPELTSTIGSLNSSDGVARRPCGGRGADNINVRAAFIHVLGDFLQSLGVLVAALVIHFEPSYVIVDPICTFLFSFTVLLTTLNIIRDAVNVLMEGIPDGINFLDVQAKLNSLPNVVRVHNLRIWSLSLDKIALSTHLVIDGDKTTSAQTLKLALRRLEEIHEFFEVTIQVEELRDDMRECKQCQEETSCGIVLNMVDYSQAAENVQLSPTLANDNKTASFA